MRNSVSGIAAGCIANAVGGWLTGKSNFGEYVSQVGLEHWTDIALYGAISGAASGAISSAVYGQDIGKGAWQGAAWGAAMGVALGAIVGYAQERIYNYVKTHTTPQQWVRMFTETTTVDCATDTLIDFITGASNDWVWEPIIGAMEINGNVMDTNAWNTYLGGVRSQAGNFGKYAYWEALFFDTTYKGRSLWGDPVMRESWFYIKDLKMFAKGGDINYTGQGMAYAKWGFPNSTRNLFPRIWKPLNWGADKINPWWNPGYKFQPNQRELFFVKYGYENY